MSPVLFPWRTVLGNVLLPVDVQRLGRDRLNARAMDLLALVGLQGFEKRYPWELSGGIKVELMPLPGSTDCVKFVATGDIQYALPSIEPLAIIRAQGVKAKTFYTAYQGYIYGIAVPQDSPIKRFADLKGKSIGVIAMGSAGMIVARALAASAGLNPETDIRVVVIEFLHKWGIVKDKVPARDLITNDLVPEINDFDPAKIIAEAKAYKPR